MNGYCVKDEKNKQMVADSKEVNSTEKGERTESNVTHRLAPQISA